MRKYIILYLCLLLKIFHNSITTETYEITEQDNFLRKLDSITEDDGILLENLRKKHSRIQNALRRNLFNRKAFVCNKETSTELLITQCGGYLCKKTEPKKKEKCNKKGDESDHISSKKRMQSHDPSKVPEIWDWKWIWKWRDSMSKLNKKRSAKAPGGINNLLQYAELKDVLPVLIKNLITLDNDMNKSHDESIGRNKMIQDIIKLKGDLYNLHKRQDIPSHIPSFSNRSDLREYSKKNSDGNGKTKWDWVWVWKL